MKTNKLLTASVFVLSACAFEIVVNSYELSNAKEAYMTSSAEQVMSNTNGRNPKASNEADSSLVQFSLDIRKGRNLDLQSFVLDDLNEIDEMQFVIENN